MTEFSFLGGVSL